MHRHVGDERTRRDIARGITAKQRAAKRGACQFDDIESGCFKRNADNFEALALARQTNAERLALATEQRVAAGIIHFNIGAAALLSDDIAVISLVQIAQPLRHLIIWRINAQHCAADLIDASRECRLNPAHRDGQDPALICLDNSEVRRELDQWWRLINADFKREARGIGKRAAAFILQRVGQDQNCF